MRVLGYDPAQGWTILELGGCAPEWVESGTVGEMSDELIAEEIAVRRADGCDLVCIERPDGFYPSKKMLKASAATLASIASGLLIAAWIGGDVAGRCRAAGVRVVEVPAPDARRSIGVRIGGVRSVDVDRQIARIIPTIVRGWPKRSSTHTRDAAVAALFGYQVARAEGKAT